MTYEQRQKVAEAVMACVGWQARVCDILAVMLLGREATTERELVREAAEYAWDHLLGEPAKPTAATIERKYWRTRKTRKGVKALGF